MQAIRGKNNYIDVNATIDMIKFALCNDKRLIGVNLNSLKIELGINVVRAIENEFDTIVPFERLKPRLFGIPVTEIEDEEQADEIKIFKEVL